MIIDAAFFVRWQRVILWAANTALGRLYLTTNWDRHRRRMAWGWFRVARFEAIAPSSYTVRLGPREYRSTFFTANHFTDKLALVLCWLPREASDGVVLRPAFASALGALLASVSGVPAAFATVTTVNTAASPSSPVDGYVAWSTSADASDARNRSIGSSKSSSSTSAVVAYRTVEIGYGDNEVSRIFLVFDTSALTADASVSAASLVLRMTGTSSDAGGKVCVVHTRPSSDSALATTDLNQIEPITVSPDVDMTEGTASGGRFDLGGFSAGADATWALSAVDWIAPVGVTKPSGSPSSGKTRLGLVELSDLQDAWYGVVSVPTADNAAEFVMADNGANKPSLAVTWTIPAPGASALWTAPKTYTFRDVHSAVDLNAYQRDNALALYAEIRPSVQSKAVDYTVLAADGPWAILLCSGSIAITLPLLSAVSGGFAVTVRSESGTVTVGGNGALVNGAATKTVTVGNKATFINIGDAWWRVLT